MGVNLTDNSDEILKALQQSIERGLEGVGQACERYAIMLTPTDTGRLKNSITHHVVIDGLQSGSVVVGSNVSYAPYVELGTGKYASDENGNPTGKGRRGYWVYVTNSDKSKASSIKKIYTLDEAKKVMAILCSKGLDVHITDGTKPAHMIGNAINNHLNEYKTLIEDALKGV